MDRKLHAISAFGLHHKVLKWTIPQLVQYPHGNCWARWRYWPRLSSSSSFSAILCPWLYRADTVSHPVIAWANIKSCLMVLESAWISLNTIHLHWVSFDEHVEIYIWGGLCNHHHQQSVSRWNIFLCSIHGSWHNGILYRTQFHIINPLCANLIHGLCTPIAFIFYLFASGGIQWIDITQLTD